MQGTTTPKYEGDDQAVQGISVEQVAQEVRALNTVPQVPDDITDLAWPVVSNGERGRLHWAGRGGTTRCQCWTCGTVEVPARNAMFYKSVPAD